MPSTEARSGTAPAVETGGLVLDPCVTHPGAGPILLDSGKRTLGSSPAADVRLPFEGVAERHCLVVARGPLAIVKAWDRRTWLNDVPVTEGRLRAGDRLVLGPVAFEVRPATPFDVLPGHGRREVVEPAAPRKPRANGHGSDSPTRSRRRSRAAVDHLAQLDSRVAEQRDRIAAVLEELHGGRPAEPAIPVERDREDDRERREQRLRELLDLVQRSEQRLLERTRDFDERRAAVDAEHRRLADEFAARESQATARAEQLDRAEAEQRRGDEELRERTAQLEARRVDAGQPAAERRQPAERESELEQRARSLAEGEKNLADHRRLFAEERAELARERDSLSRDRAALEREADERRRERAELEERRKRCDEQERVLEVDRRSFATEREQLDAERAALDERATELDARSDQLDDRERGVSEAETSLAGDRSALSQEQAELERQRERLGEREARLDERARELGQRSAALAERNEERPVRGAAPAADRLSSDRQRELDEQQAQLDARCRELDEYRTALRDERNVLRQRRAELDDAGRHVDERRAELDHDFDRLERRLHEITRHEIRLDEWERELDEIAATGGLGPAAEPESAATDGPESESEPSDDLRSALAAMFATPTDRTRDWEADSGDDRAVDDGADADDPSGTSPLDEGPEPFHLEDATDPDSVAAYMERLLARTRRPDHDSTPARPVGARQPSAPPSPPVPAPKPAGEPVAAPLVVAPAPAEPPRPRHEEDPEAARASLARFREVANRSAQTALKKHALRRLRVRAATSLGLLLASGTTAGVLLNSVSWSGSGGFATLGWAAVGLGCVAGVEFVRTTLLAYTTGYAVAPPLDSGEPSEASTGEPSDEADAGSAS